MSHNPPEKGTFLKFNSKMQSMPPRGQARPSSPAPYGANASTSVFSVSGRDSPRPRLPVQGGFSSEDDTKSYTTSPPRDEQGACMYCNSLKAKCIFDPGQSACRRCRVGGHKCVPRPRKGRPPQLSQDELQQRSLQQDRQIEDLLQQYDHMKLQDKVDARLAYQNIAPTQQYPVASGARQAALARYPLPPGAPNSPVAPDIIERSIISLDEVDALFTTFFDVVNPHFALLDPQLHSPVNLIWSCHFLFTVVCAISSRYGARDGVYQLLMEFSKDAAAHALAKGSKRVDICQGYLLLSVYPVPQKRWRDDRSHMYTGLAVRMAIELGLHQPPASTTPEHARQNLNRTRTWLITFSVDGAHASLVGKLPTVSNDYLARTSIEWYRSSRMNSPFDVHLCAHVDLLVVLAEFRGQAKGLTKGQSAHDIAALARRYDEKLSQTSEKWMRTFQGAPNVNYPMYEYRSSTFQLIGTYSRLTVLSFAFQHLVRRGLSQEDYVVRKAIGMATRGIGIVVEVLGPTGMLRYALEEHFIYAAFAASFLLNLLRPHFVHLVPADVYHDIVAKVRALIRLLASDGPGGVSLDGRHTPALYARFLGAYVERHHLPVAEAQLLPGMSIPRAGTPVPVSASSGWSSGYVHSPGYAIDYGSRQSYVSTTSTSSLAGALGAGYDHTPPAFPLANAWPELGGMPPDYRGSSQIPDNLTGHANMPEMDFTLPFFMQTVTGDAGPGTTPPGSGA